MGGDHIDLSDFTRKTLTVAGVAVLSLLLLFVLRQVSQILLVLFGAVLFAVLLDAAVRILTHYLPLSRRPAMVLVIAVIFTAIALAVVLLGPKVSEQFTQLQQRLPAAIEQLRQRGIGIDWTADLLRRLPSLDQFLDGSLMNRLASFFSNAIGALATALVIFVVGFYMAFNPELYTKVPISLLPPRRRRRGQQVLCEIGRALRRWLLGRLISMVMVGTLMTAGLWMLGVPLEFSLGFIAGLFEFVPYLGPILGSVPPLLIAVTQSVDLALYVLLLAWAIQMLENYLITPLVEEYAVSIPPGFNIIAQLFAAVLAGFLGVLFATPLLVSITVMVQMLYLEDVLGDSPTLLGESEEAD